MYLVQYVIGDEYKYEPCRNLFEVIAFIDKEKLQNFSYRVYRDITT